MTLAERAYHPESLMTSAVTGVFGPRGSGKTAVLIETARAAWRVGYDVHVVVSSESDRDRYLAAAVEERAVGRLTLHSKEMLDQVNFDYLKGNPNRSIWLLDHDQKHVPIREVELVESRPVVRYGPDPLCLFARAFMVAGIPMVWSQMTYSQAAFDAHGAPLRDPGQRPDWMLDMQRIVYLDGNAVRVLKSYMEEPQVK